MEIHLSRLEWSDFSTPDCVRFESSPDSCHPFVFQIIKSSDDEYTATVFIPGLPKPYFLETKHKTILEAGANIEEWRIKRFKAQLSPLSRLALILNYP
jgi:hypothetical protein